MTKEISTYEFIKNATSPEKGEGTLTLDVLEEALAIVKLFNKEGYNFIINEVIPATLKNIVTNSYGV